MKSVWIKMRTAWALGFVSIARVLGYRFSVRLGLNPVRRLDARRSIGPFFRQVEVPRLTLLPARKGWFEWREAFGVKLDTDLSRPPDWFRNQLTGAVFPDPHRPWWSISDFDEAVGDIKGIWEFSRFDWLLAHAQHAAHGDSQALCRLNLWLEDWVAENPAYLGPNWKCGQEASIRVMHLGMAAIILDQVERPEQGLVYLVENHLKRIAPTIRYAVGQDNNHGTSEAAALFIGGIWLEFHGVPSASTWYRQGRKWLENRVHKLFQPDGTVSQYSVTYHRLMLDTLCMVEIWRRKLELPAFSGRFYERAAAATRCLANMIASGEGLAPNFGANDGARLLPLTDTDYRDFRPSVQLASNLFIAQRFIQEDGCWDLPAKWLGVPDVDKVQGAWHYSETYPDGGYVVTRKNGVMAFFHYPRYRFRPGQSDILHLDFWVAGKNLLRDAGSYSYNCAEPWQSYFGGVSAHNTVQFDDRDQMPRLGRFLYGGWPHTLPAVIKSLNGGGVTTSSGYCDWKGGRHHRAVALSFSQLTVTDEISGKFDRATLRWRLMPGEWQWENGELVNGFFRVSVRPEGECFIQTRLAEGWESHYYGEKSPVPVLEVEVNASCTLITRVMY